MLVFTVAANILALAGFTHAAPSPIPSGGVGVRSNDTPPVYGAMTDCE